MAAKVGLDAEMIARKAAELADQDGLNGLSMGALATQLGVRTPALYHYFDGLAGLRRRLALLGLEDMKARGGRAVMGKAGDEALLALANVMRAFAVEHPGLYEAASRAPAADDPAWQALGQEVVDIILRSLSGYHLAESDALHVVRMIRIVVHGSVSLERLGAFGLPLDVDETFRRMLTAVLDYIHDHLTPA